MLYNIVLSFDDILITPKYSSIEHRSECNLDCKVTSNIHLTIPIISSPMDSVTESEMCIALNHLGGLGIIHRFQSIHKQANQVREAHKYGSGLVGVAIGATNDFVERAQELVSAGACIINIDTAHGNTLLMKEAIKRLKREVSGSFDILAGNIATFEGAKNLQDWGADGIRVGIGNGSACITRINTGCGVPQASALMNVCDNNQITVPVVCDGGIRHPGDVAKAIALGASAVMLGSLLAGTKESPGPIKKFGEWPVERLYKEYRGSASRDSKLARGEEDKHVEGISSFIPYKGKTKRIVRDLVLGLQSSMSYIGVRTLEDFQRVARGRIIWVSPAGSAESEPHLLDIFK